MGAGHAAPQQHRSSWVTVEEFGWGAVVGHPYDVVCIPGFN